MIFILVVLGLVAITFVIAQDPSDPVCGDGIIQAPYGIAPNEIWERCDDGARDGDGNPVPFESDTCTESCESKLMGWAWSNHIGWISLNDASCDALYTDSAVSPNCPPPPLPPPAPQPPSYAVQVGNDQDGLVTGYAWSDNVGWICFGSDCVGPAPGGDSPAITLDFDVDIENPPLNGWAKILSQGDDGWISLNCLNDTPACDDNSSIIYNATFGSSNFNGVDGNSNPISTSAKTLNGWGWNSNLDGQGIGWIRFNPPIGEILPWLQTKFGDIYTRGRISGNPAPSSAFNATYRILAGGDVSQFTSLSQTGAQIWVSPNFGPIDFPTPDTGYSNVLGNLDVDSLRDSPDTISITEQSDIPSLLAGEVYYTSGDLTIDNPIVFANGSSFEDGSGTIVVEGNLTINSNITYDNTNPTDRFRNLASVAWVVLGDLRIDGSVEKLAGNFIVLGNQDGLNDSGGDCDNDPMGCGQTISCYSGDCNNRLTVAGLMMSQRFIFERVFVDSQGATIFKGSEIIIYDGRLLANTPPGLGDFAKALPIWRAGTFER